MKLYAILLTISITPLLIFSFKNKQFEKNELGDIRYSVLKPEVFEHLNPGWKLMAGQPLEASSDLKMLFKDHGLLNDPDYKLIRNNVPDAQGVFLRGMCQKADTENGDPAGKRTIGEYQADAFEKHRHKYQRFTGTVVKDYSDDQDHLKANYGQMVQDNSDWAGEEVETRPRNIAVYIYIKVTN